MNPNPDNMFFFGYRARLVLCCMILILFLSGTLLYSYRYFHNVILHETDSHVLRLKQILDAHLASDRSELQRYATIVADDLRLREYMFVVTGIGGDSQALSSLYERQFGWLPIDRKVILTNDGRVLIGRKYKDLANAIQKQSPGKQSRIFYFEGKTGLEVVAVAAIKYREKVMGKVAVTQLLDQDWLNANKVITGGQYFLEMKGTITNSTLKESDGKQFRLENGRLNINKIPYLVQQIDLYGNDKNTPRLWFGISEAKLDSRLEQHQRTILVISIAGIIGIMLVGMVIIRNFSRPLMKLMSITRKVTGGELPHMKKSRVTNEFDVLSNKFAEMLEALRNKQDEIDTTHAQLEISAITDTLTGLYNRRCLNEIFPKLLAEAERENRKVFAIVLDLDYFKKVNDTYGHIAGDKCLVHFSDILKNESRTNDYLFRLGGEEFLIIMIAEGIESATDFAEKLRSATDSSPVHFDDCLIHFTVSGGISYAEPAAQTDLVFKKMLSCADIALYEAKGAGRNRIVTSTGSVNNAGKGEVLYLES